MEQKLIHAFCSSFRLPVWSFYNISHQLVYDTFIFHLMSHFCFPLEVIFLFPIWRRCLLQQNMLHLVPYRRWIFDRHLLLLSNCINPSDILHTDQVCGYHDQLGGNSLVNLQISWRDRDYCNRKTSAWPSQAAFPIHIGSNHSEIQVSQILFGMHYPCIFGHLGSI